MPSSASRCAQYEPDVNGERPPALFTTAGTLGMHLHVRRRTLYETSQCQAFSQRGRAIPSRSLPAERSHIHTSIQVHIGNEWATGTLPLCPAYQSPTFGENALMHRDLLISPSSGWTVAVHPP